MTNRKFGSAELFGRTSAVQFGPNDRTFFCRAQNFFSFHIQCQWHPFIFLFCLVNQTYEALSLGKIVKRMPELESNYHIKLKLFVCLVDLKFRSRFLCAFYMFSSVPFPFRKQNFDWLVLFGSGRMVKHCFGRSPLTL